MTNKSEPSFGWLVIARAWKDTLDTFETTWRAIVLAIALAAVSLVVQYFKSGRDAMTADLLTTAWQTVLPILVVGGAILFWNLWLAPAALAYEAAKGTINSKSSPEMRSSRATVAPKAVNWDPWKHRNKYSIYEFAKILAKTDPSEQKLNSEASAFARLLLDDVNEKKLPYFPSYADGWDGKYEISTDYSTELSKDEAIQWAQRKQFPIEHVKT